MDKKIYLDKKDAEFKQSIFSISKGKIIAIVLLAVLNLCACFYLLTILVGSFGAMFFTVITICLMFGIFEIVMSAKYVKKYKKDANWMDIYMFIQGRKVKTF